MKQQPFPKLQALIAKRDVIVRLMVLPATSGYTLSGYDNLGRKVGSCPFQHAQNASVTATELFPNVPLEVYA